MNDKLYKKMMEKLERLEKEVALLSMDMSDLDGGLAADLARVGDSVNYIAEIMEERNISGEYRE